MVNTTEKLNPALTKITATCLKGELNEAMDKVITLLPFHLEKVWKANQSKIRDFHVMRLRDHSEHDPLRVRISFFHNYIVVVLYRLDGELLGSISVY